VNRHQSAQRKKLRQLARLVQSKPQYFWYQHAILNLELDHADSDQDENELEEERPQVQPTRRRQIGKALQVQKGISPRHPLS
jgi:hypothetical protein